MVFSANISILAIAKTLPPSLDIHQELSFLNHSNGVLPLSVTFLVVPVPSVDTPLFLAFCLICLLIALSLRRYYFTCNVCPSHVFNPFRTFAPSHFCLSSGSSHCVTHCRHQQFDGGEVGGEGGGWGARLR
jgi:hypothetical protein